MGDPIRITDNQQSKLIDYIENEVTAAEREVYEPLRNKYLDLEDCYAGVVEPRSSEWMSNFPILMGATFTDAVTARIINTIEAFKPTWSLEPTRDSDWVKVARSTERLLDYKARVEMRYLRELRKTIFDVTRLGMGAMLTPWIIREEKVSQRYLWVERTTTVRTVDGIVCRHLPIRDLYYPGGYSELEYLPWWARKMRWTPMDLRVAQFTKYYENLEKAAKFLAPVEESEREAQEREGLTPGESRRVHGYEFYLKWDLKKAGDLQRYIVTYHPDTKTILRIEEDTYPEWPIRIFRYGPRSAELHGLGIIEQTKPFDDALYSLYNLLVDNFKVATMHVLKGKKGTGLRDKTKIYPLKLFLLNNPDDLQSMQLGTPFTLNPAFTRSVWELGERRAGVSDYALGRESAVASGRATATGTLALIQEGQRRFDLTISDTRRVLSQFGMFTLQMMHNRLPAHIPYMIMGDEGEWARVFLEKPSTAPYLALNVISNLSSVAMNKEIRKQDAIATFQLLGQYYREMIQLSMLLANPQLQQAGAVRETIVRIAAAASEKMKAVLEAHGEMAPEQFTDVTQPLTRGAPELPGGGMSMEGEMPMEAF